MGLNIELTAPDDARFEILASLLGLADGDHAFGKVIRVWRQCTIRGTHELSPLELTLAMRQPAGQAGAVAGAWLESGLARAGENGLLYICGTTGRTEWHEDRRQSQLDRAQKGGLERSRSANRGKNGRFLPATPATIQPAGPAQPADLIYSDLSSYSSPNGEERPPAAAGTVAMVAGRAQRTRKAPTGEHHEFIAHFTALFEQSQGGKPTWNGRTGEIVRRLLKAHGLEECKRRAEVLFTGAPSWMTSRDLQTLEAHFDKLTRPAEVRAVGRVGGVGGHVLRRGEEYPVGVQEL